MPMSDMKLPTYNSLAVPTLQALVQRGGSASIQELSEDVASLMGLPDEVLEIPHGNESQSEVDYRAAWVRTYLKKMGAIENSGRGVWSLTDYGRSLEPGMALKRYQEVRREMAKTSRTKADAATGDSRSESVGDDGEPASDDGWEDGLLSILREMAPDAFERLCQRILRESGFTKVEVTGQSGDGGIDGIGVLRVNLISFQIVFQCKRYAGSVGSGAIRDFRGSMVGRADKGLFLTTGRFSRSAEQEAVRDGAPAIDLVDGLELCRLLKDLQLGVELVEAVKVDREFFESI